jgi:DNA-binding protein YbaB
MSVAEDIGGAGFDQLFEQTRQALEAVRAGRPDSADDGEPVTGEGTAADGQVTVTAAKGGKIERIVVSPRLLRDGIEAVCEHIVVAVNAALADLRVKSAGDQALGAADPAALAGQLREVQDESLRKMASYSQALTDALAQVRGRS